VNRCSEVLSLLVDYLEKRLPPDVHARLERHLGACPACIAYLKTYESTVRLLGSLHEIDLPPELRTRLEGFLDERSKN
jgi:anti-sigma factor RsiW